jgi:hypothetical protein
MFTAVSGAGANMWFQCTQDTFPKAEHCIGIDAEVKEGSSDDNTACVPQNLAASLSMQHADSEPSAPPAQFVPTQLRFPSVRPEQPGQPGQHTHLGQSNDAILSKTSRSFKGPGPLGDTGKFYEAMTGWPASEARQTKQ